MIDVIPRWFWRLAAICLTGIFGTAVLVGWTLGAFMSETQTWQRAQDERHATHVEAELAVKETMIDAIRTIRDTVEANSKYGAAFKATQEIINSRLTRLEDREDRTNGN